MTMLQALQDLGRQPWWHLRTHWNWKTAIISVAVRGSVFFASNLAFGVTTATRVWLVDTAFRIPLVGISGAIDQAFADAAPAWAATAVVMVVVPLLLRAIECLIHCVTGTPELFIGVLTSLAFSAISNPLTLCAMRRGALVVGAEGEDSFAGDLARLPGIVADVMRRSWRRLTWARSCTKAIRPGLSVGRVGRPPIGEEVPRLIAIRVDANVLSEFRREARRRGIRCQTLINEVLASHVKTDLA
jgi:uncharacterized protein (DUF4415 family)